MIEDFDNCYRAVSSRDRRFDGRFVVAVTSTGIYCRPSCPAQTPRRENVRFYAVAAAAAAAGFRACKRCRPQAAPGSRDWDVRADLAARALRLIADGVVDQDGVGGLARRLAVSERHLHRLLTAEVGAGPLTLARTRRVQTARLLIDSTSLPISDIAFTAGYSSLRQFNDSVREAFGATPSQLRSASGRRVLGATGSIVLRLPRHPPYAGAQWLGWLAARSVAGIEQVRDGTYRRSLRLPHTAGIVHLEPAEDHLLMRLFVEDLRDLSVAVARVRALADLDAEPGTVAEVLAADPLLAPLVAARPGLRVAGHVDGFELACRAVVGQPVTVTGAAPRRGRIVEAYGDRLRSADGAVTRLFPTPEVLAEADLDGLGLTGSRRRTLRALAAAVASDQVQLHRGADREETGRALLELPGIGPWTASYIAMRALGDPDAFPAADLGLIRSSAALGGPDSAGALEARSVRWRPWRAYAAAQLWAAD
ncbi:MAG TPA: AlkA N-terminal domain-containing protein [Mycobacteriales bacterium]|nr:AlkA N-terminal domain-containing protein [Mycobacteriales bacterium]